MDKFLKKTITTPVPWKLLDFSMKVWQEAAAGKLAGSHIPPPGDKPGIYLTNLPVNRGGLAVAQATSHEPDEIRMALMWRIMHIVDVLEKAAKDDRFKGHVELEGKGEDLHYALSKRFIKAYARCPRPFKIVDGKLTPDIDALAGTLLRKG